MDNIALGILLIGQSVARGDAMGKAISGIRLENVSSKESVNGGIKKATQRKRTPEAVVGAEILAMNTRHADLECLGLAWIRSFLDELSL